MSLRHDDVMRAARLARIALTDTEARDVLAGLDRVMGMIDALQAVDTEGVAPMAYPLDPVMEATQRLREDTVTAIDRRGDFQVVAPAVKDGLYLVPKVIE